MQTKFVYAESRPKPEPLDTTKSNPRSYPPRRGNEREFSPGLDSWGELSSRTVPTNDFCIGWPEVQPIQETVPNLHEYLRFPSIDDGAFKNEKVSPKVIAEADARNKYKDDLPQNTIKRIKNTLNNLSILTVEVGWKNTVRGYHSLSVYVEGTHLSTNGKGTTSEYALASAYGELVERLQNQAHFRLTTDLSEEAYAYQGFHYAPDEKCLTVEEFAQADEEWSKFHLSRLGPGVDRDELMQKWIHISYEKTPTDFVALPFQNLMTRRISHIPVKMLSKMYMSNGMCAGNTPEEALVQGLSEIFERAVVKTVLQDKITPPVIPGDYLNKYPRISAMIENLEAKGDLEVALLDCSLGKGFPVVGLILINKANQNYFVKFGAHPIFEIAAERALTELMQGQDINNLLGATEYSYRSEIVDEHKNLLGILVNGFGVYATSLFAQTPTYKFTPFKEKLVNAGNKELLRYLLNLLARLGHHVYVRNNSFLGVPAFHVVVPGLSEIEELDDVRQLDDYAKYVRVKKYIRNLDKLNTVQLEDLIGFLEENPDEDYPILQLLNLNIAAQLPWFYASRDLFLTALYCRNGNLARASSTLNRFILKNSFHAQAKNMMGYWRCVRDYLAATDDNTDDKSLIALLTQFYPLTMVKGIMEEFRHPEKVFERFGTIKCWECGKCPMKVGCSYDLVERVYRILKEACASAHLNQKENIILLRSAYGR